MEQVVKHMTHWLLKKHLIVPEQSEWCHYMLMQSTMSILSLCLLLPVSAAIVGVWGSVFYTATFRILRQRTGGYHARTPHGCLYLQLAECDLRLIQCELHVYLSEAHSTM